MSLFSRLSRPRLRLKGFVDPRISHETSRKHSDDRSHRGQAGQALPLFVLMIFVLTGSVAVVTDVSWFWVNQQKMQRAADAGALAGAVFLPGAPDKAYAAARAATARNGYTDGSPGVTVTTAQEATNRRRLDVSVSGPIGTYFARVFGMNQVAGSAQSKAEFTLPVPMGSPQNYYGVGDFMKTMTASPAAWSGGAWSNPNKAYVSDGVYATASSNLSQEIWKNFSFGAFDTNAVFAGLTVNLEANVSAGTSGCQIKAEVSWNGGVSWDSLALPTPDKWLTSNDAVYALGNLSDGTVWGTHSWKLSDFTSANFAVRLTYLRGSGCGTVSLDQVTAVPSTTIPTFDPTGVVTLASQGFWGAIITKGGSRENGDEFSPLNDNLKGVANPEYESTGYDYAVIVPSGSGKVAIYDATFCETGSNGSGNLGAGDHWIGGSPNGVTTVYSLWNENGTPYNPGDDTQVATSGNTFVNEKQADYSGAMGTPADSGLTNCTVGPNKAYHNGWYTLASGLAAGRYRMNVNTSSANNLNTNAENMWSAWVTSSGTPQVYGEARMAAYNNLPAGTQKFYLAQIDASNAGKTMEISLFDPGDVSGDAYLRILSPNGNAYNYATFSYTADNGAPPGVNVTQIQTAATSGGSRFQDALITIDIVLPNNYGTTGLKPLGELSAGWWKIEYQVNGGNDTTTWQVAMKGSPVHLVR